MSDKNSEEKKEIKLVDEPQEPARDPEKESPVLSADQGHEDSAPVAGEKTEGFSAPMDEADNDADPLSEFSENDFSDLEGDDDFSAGFDEEGAETAPTKQRGSRNMLYGVLALVLLAAAGGYGYMSIGGDLSALTGTASRPALQAQAQPQSDFAPAVQVADETMPVDAAEIGMELDENDHVPRLPEDTGDDMAFPEAPEEMMLAETQTEEDDAVLAEEQDMVADEGALQETAERETSLTEGADSIGQDDDMTDPMMDGAMDEMPEALVEPVMTEGPPVPAIENGAPEDMGAEQELSPEPMVENTAMDTAPAPVDDGALISPKAEASLDPAVAAEALPAPSALVPIPEQATTAMPFAPSAPSAGPDHFYDSTLNVPRRGVESMVGLRKVDPVQEPASKWMIVHKDSASDDWEALLVSANRALKLGRYEAAVDMYDRLYDRNPRDERILMGRAYALQKMGRVDSALSAYDELLDVNPNNKEALLNMLGALQQRYPAVALRRLMALQDRYPDNAAIAAQIAVSYADMGDVDQALHYIDTAAMMEPENPLHYFNMAVIAERAGKRDVAIKAYEKALEVDTIYGSSQGTIARETIYDRLHVLRSR